ncbi:MAG: AAA family ATPase [Candidatus Moranbacteria bacterium]|nr:AAA family ATPase [Candidatus Moranbacteria bacterium]
MQGKSKYLYRFNQEKLINCLKNNQSVLILGPRQVGKTTLIKNSLKNIDHLIYYPLHHPKERLRLEKNPELIIDEVEAAKNKPFVFIDEAQKIPSLLDAVQYLIDEDKATFIITGSSARKLRRKKPINLLAGRVIFFNLDPLAFGEMGLIKQNFIPELSLENLNPKENLKLNDLLLFGSLPQIIKENKETRKELLSSYTHIYLEEEIRAEALSRKIGDFSRFLELAALESGTSPNFKNLSNQSGVSQISIKEYYQLLEDTLIVERLDPYLKKARKRIFTSSRYYFFDLGVRNALANLPLEDGSINALKGPLFEHLIVLEILKRLKILNKGYRAYYWRTTGGAEVDLVIDLGNKLIPIEIKASEYVSLKKLKGLKNFLKDYSSLADHGYVINLAKRPQKIDKNITAIPWNYL